jgi:hypothetical protein
MRYLLALFAAGVLLGQNMHFEEKTLAADLTGGYQVVACDVNGDGKPDLIALPSDMPDLVWFENPGWQRHTLASGLHNMINLACWSSSAGPPQLAAAYGFSMDPQKSAGIVSILQPNSDVRQPWSVREIDRLPTSHRLRWADINGSGRKVLINAPLASATANAPDYRGHVPLVYYVPGEWKRKLIGEAEEGIMHGIFVTDWDHNGRDAVLIGSFLGIHLYRFNGAWSRTEIARGSPASWPKCGTSDVTVAHLGSERILGAIEPWHGNEVVIYREKGGVWNREVIDDTLLDGHTIEAADLNGDGRDELIVGYRGKPYGVNIYRLGGSAWIREELDRGSVSAASCTVADLYGNGQKEIACIGQATHNLKLWRPTGK